uniref:Tetraspanin 8 n=1 Tax=Strix occidentalis caurina TaxID=311401 RepID=A0A8D0EWR7_STROC
MAGVSGCMKYSMFIFNFLFWLKDFFPFSFQELEIDSRLFAGVDMLIAVGSIIMILGFLGCCGAIKESRCMLLLFFIGLLLILILQVTGGILGAVYRSQVQYYSAFSLMSSQSSYQCCGLLKGPADWGKNFNTPLGSNKICECDVEHPSADLCTSFEGRLIYKTPCGDVIIKYLKDHLLIIMGIAFGLAVIEVPVYTIKIFSS